MHYPCALISSLMGPYYGEPIIVLGGALSLLQEWEQIPAGIRSRALTISANEHGSKFLSKIRHDPADFIFAADIEHQAHKVPMVDWLAMQAPGVPIISPRFYGKYRLHEYHQRKLLGNSGILAIWLAWKLGGHPVIPIGISHYQGGTYWHAPTAESSGLYKPDGDLQGKARDLARKMPGAIIRPIDGPLTQIWKRFDPHEIYPAFEEHPWHLHDRLKKATKWRFTHDHLLASVANVQFQIGDTCLLTPPETTPIKYWIAPC